MTLYSGSRCGGAERNAARYKDGDGERKREDPMNPDEARGEEKKLYVIPKLLATYSKEELDQTIKPHGPNDTYTGIDLGCGCGCS